LIIYYGLALFAGNVVIASDEGAKQSPVKISRDVEIASSQAPRNDKLLNYSYLEWALIRFNSCFALLGASPIPFLTTHS